MNKLNSTLNILKKVIEKSFPLIEERSSLLNQIQFLLKEESEELGFFTMYNDVSIPKYNKKGDSGLDIKAYLSQLDSENIQSLLTKYHEQDIQKFGTEIKDLIEYSNTDGFICITLKPGARVIIPTGLKMKIPEGYELQIRPKSSTATNTGLILVSSPGTVDSNFSDELKIIIMNAGNKEEHIFHDSKIAQLVLSKVEKASIIKLKDESELNNHDRS